MVGQRRKTSCDLFQDVWANIISLLPIVRNSSETSKKLIEVSICCCVSRALVRVLNARLVSSGRSWITSRLHCFQSSPPRCEMWYRLIHDTVFWDVTSLPPNLGDHGWMLKVFHPAALILRPKLRAVGRSFQAAMGAPKGKGKGGKGAGKAAGKG